MSDIWCDRHIETMFVSPSAKTYSKNKYIGKQEHYVVKWLSNINAYALSIS